jgi:alpha-1,2-mannosyltransferase
VSRVGAAGERLRQAVLPLFLVLGMLLALNPRRGIDFTVFRTAGERWLAGTSLYRAEDGPMPFKYAPPVAVLLAFLALIPRGLGAVLWNGASVLLLHLAIIQLPRVDPAPSSADGTWAALALAGPIGTVLFYGQVDLLLLGLLVLAAAAVGTRGDGGTALGLSVLTKPPAALAVLFFVGRRRWRALVVAAGVVLLVTAVFALRTGVDTLGREVAAWQDLVERSTLEWVTGPNPQGLPTLILEVAGRFGTPPAPETLMLAQLSAVLFFAALILALRADPAACFRMTCLSIAMCSPLAWRANFVLALPALRRVVAAARWGDGFCRLLLGLVVLASVLTSGVFLDRTATERLLAFRPWGLLGLLLVVVEFSAPRVPPAVRASASPE